MSDALIGWLNDWYIIWIPGHKISLRLLEAGGQGSSPCCLFKIQRQWRRPCHPPSPVPRWGSTIHQIRRIIRGPTGLTWRRPRPWAPIPGLAWHSPHWEIQEDLWRWLDRWRVHRWLHILRHHGDRVFCPPTLWERGQGVVSSNKYSLDSLNLCKN